MVVIGVGNELRGDDGAGLAVARAVRDHVDRVARGAIAIRELGGIRRHCSTRGTGTMR